MHKQNSELKDQLTESEKDYQRLHEAKIKIESQLDTLQDQLQQEEDEKQRLKQIVPHLQEAIILIEASCRTESAVGTSGAQRTLSRINDLIHEQEKHEKFPPVVKRRHHLTHPSDASKRDSTLSTFSDISSVTESSLADEDRNSDSTSYLERNRLSMDFNKPVVSDLHRSVKQNQIKSKSSAMNINQNEALEQTEAASIQNLSSTVVIVQNQQCNPMESTKGTHERHTLSETFMNGQTSTKSYLNIQTRPRHRSESDVLIKKQNQSQGFHHDRRVFCHYSAQAQSNSRAAQREHDSQEETDELSVILSKRREKIDSESTFQRPVTYQSQ